MLTLNRTQARTVRRGLSPRHLMAFLSVAIAMTAVRYFAIPWHIWPNTDPKILANNQAIPLPLFFHALFAGVALATGPFQFLFGPKNYRSRSSGRSKVHRYLGRTYGVCCILAGLAATVVALHAAGGPIAGLGFEMLAVSWIGTTAAGWRAAVAGDFDRHRILMRYSFAMTFAAVTLRLQAPIGLVLLGFTSYTQMSPWLAYTAWIPNVIAVWLYTTLIERRKGLPISASPQELQPVAWTTG